MKKRLFNAIVSFILCLTLCANCFTGVSALSYAQPDGYHLRPAGYAAWVDYLRSHTAE